MHRLAAIDKAVAGVHDHRLRVRRIARQQVEDGCHRQLAVLVCHVSGFRHGRGREDGVADDMHARGAGRFHGQPVDVHPAGVDQFQAGIAGDVAGALRRDDVEHIGLECVELKDGRVAGDIDVAHFAVRPVFQMILVQVVPGFDEQSLFRLHVFVGIQDDDFRFWLVRFEVIRDQTGAFVGAGRATVRRFRNAQGKDTAIGHGFQLAAQSHCLRAGFPGMGDFFLRGGIVQAGDLFVHEVDARREDHPVVTDAAAVGKAQRAGAGIERDDLALDDADAPVVFQIVIADGNVCHGLAAVQHQIGNRAGNEVRLALDQRHLHPALAPQAQVFGRRGTTVAATDHDHMAAGLVAAAAAVKSGQGTGAGAGLEEIASLNMQHVFPLIFARRNSRRSASVVPRCSPWRSAA